MAKKKKPALGSALGNAVFSTLLGPPHVAPRPKPVKPNPSQGHRPVLVNPDGSHFVAAQDNHPGSGIYSPNGFGFHGQTGSVSLPPMSPAMQRLVNAAAPHGSRRPAKTGFNGSAGGGHRGGVPSHVNQGGAAAGNGTGPRPSRGAAAAGGGSYSGGGGGGSYSGGGGAAGGGSSAGGGARPARPAGSKPKPVPIKPAPDSISQLIAGAIQQNQRLTDGYLQQNEAARQAVVADAAKLAGYTELPKVQGLDPLSQQLVDTYSGLLNNQGRAQAGLNATTANTFQQLMGTNADAARQQAVEFARMQRANEPAMRQQQAAAEAKNALDMAQAQYLRDKLSLAGKQAVDNSNLNWARLQQQGQIATMNNATRTQTSLLNAQLKQALAGSKLTQQQKQQVQKWVDNHIYAKDPTTGAMIANPNASWREVYGGLSTSVTDPISAAVVALQYAKPSIQNEGPNRFYAAIRADMSKRQAIRLVAAAFGQKVANQIKRYGYSSTGGSGEAVSAAPAVSDAASSLLGAVQ